MNDVGTNGPAFLSSSPSELCRYSGSFAFTISSSLQCLYITPRAFAMGFTMLVR